MYKVHLGTLYLACVAADSFPFSGGASPPPPTAYFATLRSFPPVRERLEKEKKRLLRRLHYTFLICVERDGNIFSMFFVVLTIVFLEAGLIMKSPHERFVEALFWTTLGTYTLYEQ